jgi:3-oxoacyl-[acyl-carrier protein] reductase
MELELKGRTALVTGASYGLGYACAQVLAQEGAKVAIASRDERRLDQAASKIQSSADCKPIAIACDLSNKNSVDQLAIQATEKLGSIDILVVSTGHPPTFPFSEASDELWEQGLDLILRPVITLSRTVIPQMKKKGYGRLIFIGSIFGLEPEKSSVIQSTLRTGLNALAKCIATENAEFGITANVICPGYFETPLVEGLAGQYAKSLGKSTATVLDEWKDYSPMKKYGKPEDLGSLVAFLASPRAEFITGTTITIDGGAVRQC